LTVMTVDIQPLLSESEVQAVVELVGGLPLG
jgi:hypothetical protein